MMSYALMIVALAGFVSAKSYSNGCMNTLVALGAKSDVAACLNPAQLLPLLLGTGNGGDSVVNPIDAWVTGMCAMPACSPDTLAATVKDLTTGCGSDLGLPSLDQVQSVIDMVNTNYATARKAVCLKEGNTLCVTQMLNTLQDMTGTLSLDDNNIRAISRVRQAGLPVNITCTNCMKGVFSLFSQELPGEITPDDRQYAQSTCGDSFVDGGIPPSLIQTALGATPVAPDAPPSSPSPSPSKAPAPVAAAPAPSTSKKSSALGRSSGKFTRIAISALVVVSTVVGYLA